MKIVINACHGGFNLSDEAVKTYFDLKGWGKPKEEFYGDRTLFYRNDEYFSSDDISRNDLKLIEVVETLGAQEASGRFSNLEIVEVESGTKYRICEYDGYEYIETEHDIDWSVAK